MIIAIGEGSCGIAAGASKIRAVFENEFDKNIIKTVGCIGMCFLEPIVDLYEGEELFKRFVKIDEYGAKEIAGAVKTGDFSKIEHLEISKEDEVFLTRQTRIALRNCGKIDPGSIEDYRKNGSYSALDKVIKAMT
ncbi:MAG: NADH-quinone oxidoreductase subunit F, partial [Oscillospiraceae bacterium]|nr:NADH-quinone oxidoreductase subunit F [Oscillospiraceae bacterium]